MSSTDKYLQRGKIMEYTQDDIKRTVEYEFLDVIEEPDSTVGPTISIVLEDLISFFGFSKGYYYGLAAIFNLLQTEKYEKKITDSDREPIEFLLSEISRYHKNGDLQDKDWIISNEQLINFNNRIIKSKFKEQSDENTDNRNMNIEIKIFDNKTLDLIKLKRSTSVKRLSFLEKN